MDVIVRKDKRVDMARTNSTCGQTAGPRCGFFRGPRAAITVYTKTITRPRPGPAKSARVVSRPARSQAREPRQ